MDLYQWIENNAVVWVHPHGSPEQAVKATVDVISNNKRAIAIRLHCKPADKPAWVRFIAGSVLVHRDYVQIEMLLLRETIGPWEELLQRGHYEIEKDKPEC